MADITFAEVARLAEKLTTEEQRALIKYLQERSQARDGQSKSLSQKFDELFGFIIFDVGQWPEGLTLRREDEYGDSDR
jgi:hypothetical protein